MNEQLAASSGSGSGCVQAQCNTWLCTHHLQPPDIWADVDAQHVQTECTTLQFTPRSIKNVTFAES